MVDVDKSVIARYKTQGKNFEILVDCENAIAFKTGSNIDLNDVLTAEEIFEDVKKGKHASEIDMKKIFNTDDKKKICEQIIKKGDVQVTAEYQRKLREIKEKQIIDLIHRNAIDPKTGNPHPPQRIKNAVEEAKIRIDNYKSAEEQIQDIISQLKTVLPIKFEVRTLMIKVPAQYAAKSYNSLKLYGKLLKEEWQNDGSLVVNIELPAGLQEDLFSKLNNLTHGSVESKIIGVK